MQPPNNPIKQTARSVTGPACARRAPVPVAGKPYVMPQLSNDWIRYD